MFPDYFSIFYDYDHMYMPYLSGDSLIFFFFFIVCGVLGLFLWFKCKEYNECLIS